VKRIIYEGCNIIDNNHDRLHCSELYGLFKGWFKNNNPNTKVPNNKVFIDGLRKHKVVDKIKIDGLVQLGITKILLEEDN